MPFVRRRKFTPKKTFRRRRVYKKKTHFNARKIVAATRESKYLQASISGQSVDNVGTVTGLTMPTQGDGSGSRDGNVIQWSSIIGRLAMVAGDSTNLVRFAIFQWHPDNNVDAPSIGKLLQDTATNPAISPWISAKNQRAKFTVLYHRIKGLTTSGSNQVVTNNIHVPAKYMKRTFFNDAASTGKNVIYIMYISDSGAATHPNISLCFTYRFKEY